MIEDIIDSLKRPFSLLKKEKDQETQKDIENLIHFALNSRIKTEQECEDYFKNFYKKDALKALQTLFFIRDIRKGLGERRFFRVCFRWISSEDPQIAQKYFKKIVEIGRYDDLYCVIGTKAENDMFIFLQEQLQKDLEGLQKGDNISLLGKWLKSENSTSKETREIANKTRIFLKMSHKDYRLMLSALRSKIDIIEKKMSLKEWNSIKFEHIPEKAQKIYENTFKNNKKINQKYREYIQKKESDLKNIKYPFDLVRLIRDEKIQDSNIKYWDLLSKDLTYPETLCVIDNSLSMKNSEDLDIAIGFNIFFNHFNNKYLKNKGISFTSDFHIFEMGETLTQQIKNLYNFNYNEKINIEGLYQKMLQTIPKTELPERIFIFSDSPIEQRSYWNHELIIKEQMKKIRKEWEDKGYSFPKLYYWNLSGKADCYEYDDFFILSGQNKILFQHLLDNKDFHNLYSQKIEENKYIEEDNGQE